MNVIKARGTAIKYGTYEFSDQELQDKGVELSGALRTKDELEARLKEIKSEFKNKTDKANSIIRVLSNDLSQGERSGDMICLVSLENRDGQWFKVFESQDYGHEVAAEPFDYGRDSHLFDFSEKRDNDNGVKKVLFEGEEIMTVPLAPHERQLSLEDEESDATLAKYQERHEAGQEEEDVPEEDDEVPLNGTEEPYYSQEESEAVAGEYNPEEEEEED